MIDGQITNRGIWMARGGNGRRLLVLLHGLGANASVWERMIPLIRASWDGQWVAPDLRGHGRSIQEGPYGYGVHATDIADIVNAAQATDVMLVGHSFGGVVAALAATGWFGIPVRAVAAFGVKIEWSAEEVTKAHELSRKAVRAFVSRAQAIERYLKLSGLLGLLDPSSETAALGVFGTDGDYRVAMDPRAYGAVGPSVASLLRLCEAPLRLAAGDRDAMVTLDQMRDIDPAARVFEGVGHNAHLEAPERVWNFIAGCRDEQGRPPRQPEP